MFEFEHKNKKYVVKSHDSETHRTLSLCRTEDRVVRAEYVISHDTIADAPHYGADFSLGAMIDNLVARFIDDVDAGRVMN